MRGEMEKLGLGPHPVSSSLSSDTSVSPAFSSSESVIGVGPKPL